MFNALLATNDADGFNVRVQAVEESDLPSGSVEVAVGY